MKITPVLTAAFSILLSSLPAGAQNHDPGGGGTIAGEMSALTQRLRAAIQLPELKIAESVAFRQSDKKFPAPDGLGYVDAKSYLLNGKPITEIYDQAWIHADCLTKHRLAVHELFVQARCEPSQVYLNSERFIQELAKNGDIRCDGSTIIHKLNQYPGTFYELTKCKEEKIHFIAIYPYLAWILTPDLSEAMEAAAYQTPASRATSVHKVTSDSAEVLKTLRKFGVTSNLAGTHSIGIIIRPIGNHSDIRCSIYFDRQDITLPGPVNGTFISPRHLLLKEDEDQFSRKRGRISCAFPPSTEYISIEIELDDKQLLKKEVFMSISTEWTFNDRNLEL